MDADDDAWSPGEPLDASRTVDLLDGLDGAREQAERGLRQALEGQTVPLNASER